MKLFYCMLLAPLMLGAMSEDCCWVSRGQIYYANRMPALFYAVKRHSIPDKTLKDLLAQGADPNQDHETWGTLLQIALDSQKYTAVPLLLDAGADPNKMGYKTWTRTPLAMVVEQPNNDIVQLLLEHGASVNSKENSGYTPLYYATEKYYNPDEKIQRRCIEKLLLWGANPDIIGGFDGKESMLTIIRQSMATGNHLADYIEHKQITLIELVTALLVRWTINENALPGELIDLIISYCYPHDKKRRIGQLPNQSSGG